MAMSSLVVTVRGEHEAVRARVVEALATEGFGVLTEIDVQGTLATKLGVPFRRYRILGACNPPLAHRALEADLEVGLMMPCNVVVHDGDDGEVVVRAVDPMRSAEATGNAAVIALVSEVKERLARVIARVG